MEIKKISDELERIVESKRIPNALIFETDGLNSELEMSLGFAKKLLLSNEQNPVNQNKIVKDLHSLSYPDLHIVFPIPISNNKKKDLYDYHYKAWSEMALKNNMRVSLSNWKETISYGNKQPIINIDSVRSVIKKLAVSSFPPGEYGYLQAKVTRIGADALDQQGAQRQRANTFPMQVTLEKNADKSVLMEKLKPGMQVSALIVVRQRPVISLLTDMFTKGTEDLQNSR